MSDISTSSPLPGMSIFVTCYNLEHYIRETLASVFAQDYRGPVEVVIVDDCSQDASWDEIRKAVKELGEGWDVTLIRNERNMGILATTEVAWSAAKYEWLIEVDGDDIQLPDRCSKVAQVILKHPELVAILFSSRNMAADGTILNSYFSYDQKDYEHAPEELCLNTPEEIFDNYFYSDHVFYPLGAMECYKRTIFEQWGKHQHCSREVFQDTVWTWRCKLSGPVYACKQIACCYRRHEGSLFHTPPPISYSEHIRAQLHTSRLFLQRYTFLTHALADIDQALATPGLSNWKPELLLEAKRIFEKELPIKKIQSEWWNISFFRRLRHFLRIYKELSPYLRSWMLKHILPLPCTAFLCWMKVLLKKQA